MHNQTVQSYCNTLRLLRIVLPAVKVRLGSPLNQGVTLKHYFGLCALTSKQRQYKRCSKQKDVA
jgi:hypothetical protein